MAPHTFALTFVATFTTAVFAVGCAKDTSPQAVCAHVDETAKAEGTTGFEKCEFKMGMSIGKDAAAYKTKAECTLSKNKMDDIKGCFK